MACLALGLPVSARAQDSASLTGLWSVVVISPEGQHPVSMAVVEQDGRLAGVLNSAAGQVPLEGTRTPEAITLRFSVSHEGAPLPITLTAAPGAHPLTGTANYGGQAEGTWTANRAAPTGANGAWTFSADAGDGPIPGALTLLEDGGKVTGRLLVPGRGVDCVMSGTNLDGTLTLKASGIVDGSPVVIEMPGKVDGAAIAGTFTVADLSGRWTATRQ